MEQVETLSKPTPESPNLPKSSPVKSSQENGIRVSPNGKEVSSNFNDLGGSGEVVDGTEDAVHLGDGGDEMSLEDSEVNNGASSLLQMQGSKSLHGLDSVLDVIQHNENMDVESGNGDGDGVSPVADVCGDVNINSGDVNVSPIDVEEKGQVDEGLGSETLVENEGKISNLSGGNSEELVKQDSGDDDHDFGAGDFVWGKIKSHPWWPGRIYDPSDASDSARKVKRRDKILVGYFGDHTFAWCNSSQLKPLDEDFEKMSAQSNANIFVNAVEKAMDDVGRLVDLNMTCACVPKGNLIGFGRTLSKNAGIKEGLLIPEGGIDKLSSTLFEPIEILGSIKDTAQVGTATNKLDFTVITSWLSAFYRAKGGYQLPFYNDPKPIEGLEDKSGDWVVDLSNYSNGGDVRVQGPIEEDWLSSPWKQEQAGESMLRKCQGVSEAGHYQRRKQKSLAKILEGPADTEVENQDDVFTEGGVTSSNLTSSANRKKRKSVGENTNADAKNEAVDATLVEAASSAGKKKRKANDEVDAEGNKKRGRKKRKVTNEADADADTEGNKKTEDVADTGAITPVPGGKKRKGKKLSETVAEENAKFTGLDANTSGAKKETVKTPSSRGRKKKESADVKDDGSASAKKVKSNSSNRGKAKEQIKDGSLLRERKRSKYLSPPYTNLDRGQKKNEVEAEYLKISGEARLAEKMTKAASQLIGSPSILKPSGEKVQKQSSEKPGAGHATSDISGSVTLKQDSNIIVDPMMGSETPKQDTNNIIVDPMMVKAPASEVLSKMRSAALNPTSLKETNSVNAVEEFVSAFRNSSYVLDGEYRELFSGKKRKLQKSEAGSSVKEQYKTDQTSADQKSRPTKSKKKEEAKMDKPETKEAASAPEVNTKGNDEFNGAVLYASFGPGSNLPTKNDLIQIYGKYGALDELETEMFYTNVCARIVFLESSAGEEAFNESLLSSPFKAATVTFRLQYKSAETKSREVREISSNEVGPQAKERAMTSQGVPSGSQSSDSNESQLNFVIQRLETIALLVEGSVGKIAPDMKSTLEGEMKVVLEKVRSMVDGSST